MSLPQSPKLRVSIRRTNLSLPPIDAREIVYAAEGAQYAFVSTVGSVLNVDSTSAADLVDWTRIISQYRVTLLSSRFVISTQVSATPDCAKE